jgi:hypothetical protein
MNKNITVGDARARAVDFAAIPYPSGQERSAHPAKLPRCMYRQKRGATLHLDPEVEEYGTNETIEQLRHSYARTEEEGNGLLADLFSGKDQKG